MKEWYHERRTSVFLNLWGCMLRRIFPGRNKAGIISGAPIELLGWERSLSGILVAPPFDEITLAGIIRGTPILEGEK